MSTACHICGKKFLNEANMRKHLRFHSGRNFPCKYGCDVVYPNVAELVKHLRAIHPDLPKRSQAALTDMAKKQMDPPHHNGRVEPKVTPPIIGASPVLEVPSKPKMELLHKSQVSQPSQSTDTVARKSREGIMGVHCTICKKKFSTYGSMCRHRRSVHRVIKMAGTFVNVDSAPDVSLGHEEEEEEEEETSTWDEPIVTRTKHIEANVERMYEDIEREQARMRSGEKMNFSPPPSPTSFYQNVADNIAENLSCYLDGGSDALMSARQYIKIDDYVPLDEAETIKCESVDINWSTYNFPPYFMPVDPVIPLPPSPPPVPPSVKENILVLDDDKTLAYPTRSAVAEREATRRSSVGAAEKPMSGENGRLPRRASVGSFEVQSKDGSKLVRRASVGSFDDQKNTEPGAEGISGTDRNPVTSQTVAALGAQNGETNMSETTEQLSPVQDTNTVEKKKLSSNSTPASEDDVFDCHGKDNKDVETAPSTDSADVVNNQSHEKSVESGKEMANEKEKLVESVSKTGDKDKPIEHITKPIGDQNDAIVSGEEHEDTLTKHPSALNESWEPLQTNKPSDACVPGDKSADLTQTSSSVQDEMSEVNFDDDILVCKESLSNFSSPDITEMAASHIEDNVSFFSNKQTHQMINSEVKPVAETEENSEQVKFEKGDKDIASNGVSSEKQSDNNTAATMQTKDSSKPDHISPSLRSSKPSEKPIKDLSEQELEFLSKGIVFYVRGNKEQCTHITDESTVPMRCTESKDEEDYLETLQLAVKKVKAKPASSSQKNSNSEVTADTSELKSTTEETDREKEPNQTETCSVVEESSLNGTTRSEACEGAVQNSDSSDKKHGSVCEKNSSASTIPSVLDTDKETESKPLLGQKVSPPEAADNDDSDLDEELLTLQTKWQLQVLQERVAIDREAEEICQRCHPQNTEHGEPCKRTAEDFAKMRFGRKNAVFCVCSLCRRYYYGVDSLLRHQMKKHPSIQCSYFEVENGHGLEMLFYPQPSTRGVLAESVLLPPQHVSQDTYTCTRCKLTVKQYSRLRAHILNCDPRTPTTPHTRKKKPKSNRHRFMEQMLPDSGNNEAKEKKAAEKNHTVRALNFKSKGQGTVMGLRKKTNPFSSRNHKLLQRPGKKEATSSAPPQPVGRLPSTRTKTQSWKMSQSVASTSSSKSSESPGKGGRAQRRRNYELLYNPAAHVRRREKTECVDIHQCQGCRLSFRTLPLLERHTKNCTGKDKILSQRHVASKLLDKEGAKKHSCHYCPKRFKYLKGVYNHYNNNFCRVRAERLSGKGLTPDDVAHEDQLQASLQRQAWNKMENQDHTDVIQGRAHLHDDGTIIHTRKKGGWPKGLKRSNKRRRNGWTCIKRRKPDGDGNESSSSPSKSRTSPRVTASVSSSTSATSAAMSELEARLREPIGVKRKRASRDLSASQELVSSSPVTKHDGKSPALKQAKATSPKKKKARKAEDDLSEAPVIDRMDMEPPIKSREGKHMSPDLEPPTLFPISPSVATEPQSAQNSKKMKRKTVDAATQENSMMLINGGNIVQPTTKDKLWPALGTSSKANTAGKSTNTSTSPQPALTPQANLGDGMNAPVFVLEQVTDASGNKAGQYKLVQLKIPTVLPRLNSNQATVLHDVTGVKKAQSSNTAPGFSQPSSCSTITSEQNSLPPNFLFPPLSELGKNGEGKGEEGNESSSSSAGTEQRKDTMKSPSQETVESGRKARQRKRKKVDDSPTTTTIKDLFKNKKSPTRSTSNSNTIKSIDVQCTRTNVTVSGSSVVGSLPSSTPISTSLTSPAYNVPANAVPTLLPGGGITMLPPGAVIAVLPNTSAVLPSSVSSPVSPSSTSVKNVHTLTNSLQGAVPEGKFVLLDPRNLTSLLSSASVPSPSAKSPNKDGVKGQVKSPVKTGNKSTAKPQPDKMSNLTVKEKTEGKGSVAPPPKPASDVPNFLFDGVGKSEPSPSDSNPQSQNSCDKKTATHPAPVSIQDDELEKGTGKSKGRKPKRGPPPSVNSPNGSKVKSMTMMTSPGVHTMVSLNVPCTSSPTTNTSQNNSEQTESERENQSSETGLKSNITEMKTRSSRAKSDSSGLSDLVKAKDSVCDGVKKTMRSAKTKTGGLPDTGDKNSLTPDTVGVEGDMIKGDKTTANNKSVANTAAEKKTVVLNVPVVTKRMGKRASPSTDDDDLPLSAVAAKIKDK